MTLANLSSRADAIEDNNQVIKNVTANDGRFARLYANYLYGRHLVVTDLYIDEIRDSHFVCDRRDHEPVLLQCTLRLPLSTQ